MLTALLLLVVCSTARAFFFLLQERPEQVGGRRLHSALQATPKEDAETTVLGLLGPSGRVSLSAKEEAELEECLGALCFPKTETPTAADLTGRWTLLYATKSRFDARSPLGRRVDGTAPGFEALFASEQAEASSSPIQRLLLSSLEAVTVQQTVDLAGGRVDQLVSLGDVALRLSAAAAFDAGRINFTFDLAYFQLGPVRVPYPVPFRLLGDEAKGWLDTPYVSDTLRVSKGNKGTTFILRRQ
mmetsp:Transcript_15217/g.46145  ORF Transcript_15217/g.46145 Transcript_15217/m.46145 type:complete len:243 (+) Transcript_15217:31-759(+)